MLDTSTTESGDEHHLYGPLACKGFILISLHTNNTAICIQNVLYFERVSTAGEFSNTKPTVLYKHTTHCENTLRNNYKARINYKSK